MTAGTAARTSRPATGGALKMPATAFTGAARSLRPPLLSARLTRSPARGEQLSLSIGVAVT